MNRLKNIADRQRKSRVIDVLFGTLVLIATSVAGIGVATACAAATQGDQQIAQAATSAIVADVRVR